MSYADMSATLRQNLNLDFPPIALARAEAQPNGVPGLTSPVPSACALWRRAEQSVFYASARDHFNCPIGAMVMGFSLPEATSNELMDLVGQMCQINYIKPEEVPHIPKFPDTASGIVYGPLASFPLEPDVVLIWTTPVDAMLLQESTGATMWSDNPGGVIFGRPGCGALPTAVARGKVTMSLGCAGMRTFTEIPDDQCLVAIPGAKLAAVTDALGEMVAVNAQMKEHYLAKKSQF